MLALGSARTDPAAAARWLRWLAAHRTGRGALPENVNPDGSPASVAPLGWTSALVQLTLAVRTHRAAGPSQLTPPSPRLADLTSTVRW